MFTSTIMTTITIMSTTIHSGERMAESGEPETPLRRRLSGPLLLALRSMLFVNLALFAATMLPADLFSSLQWMLGGLSILTVAFVLRGLLALGQRFPTPAPRPSYHILLPPRDGSEPTGGRAFRAMYPGPDIVAFPWSNQQTGTVAASTRSDILTVEERRTIGELQDAGYSVAQIARLVGRTVADVQTVLRDDRHQPSDVPRRRHAA